MDANKKVEVNGAFVADWQKRKCLWDVNLEDIKIAILENLGEIIWNYQLFYIVNASPKQFFVFFFAQYFSFLKLLK